MTAWEISVRCREKEPEESDPQSGPESRSHFPAADGADTGGPWLLLCPPALSSIPAPEGWGPGDAAREPPRSSGPPRPQQCKPCPAAAGFPAARASFIPSLLAFLWLVKVKRGLKCYSHSVYFAGAQNFLFIIRALLSSTVYAGLGSLQAPARDS